ncbi:MAG: leucine-rich repeat protein [Ruminococcus sp.]|nr:leucine-rich repeat protein [Ruminococcus sp.]
MKKKVLSGLLALALVFSSAAALPQGVFDTVPTISASAVSSATSGTCGENLTWTLSDGVLTISGTGAMTDYGSSNSPFLDRTDIQSVVIKSGVTSIGKFVFFRCTGLTSITIPSGVKSIGRSAFEGCTNLKSVIIPGSVTSIDEWAFAECESLESLTLPSSLEEICQYTFVRCKKLKSVTIPNNVKTVGFEAFDRCDSLQSVTIPGSVEIIEPWAFGNCPNLTSVTISNGVKTIDYDAFFGCTNLKRLTIPSSVTSIGNEAFANCKYLESITIPDSVTSIGKNALYNCPRIKSVIVPKSVTSIGSKALGYYDDNGTTKKVDQFMICCEKSSAADTYAWDNGFDRGFIEGDYIYKFVGTSDAMIVGYTGSEANITVPSQLGGKTVSGIHAESFKNCTSLKSVTVPDCVEGIGDSAFSSCTNLKSITLPNQLDCISRWLFDGCTSLKSVTIPNGVTSIGAYAFRGCTNLTSVTIPNGVKYLDPEAFKDCTSLKSVTIPGSVTNIDYNVFKNCTSLTSVTFKNGVTAIGNYMFDGCSKLSSVSIPDSVTTIEPYAFFGCTSLNSITLTKNVTSIGDRSLGYYIDTKTGRTEKVEGFTIYGEKGSAAEKYANDNGFTFVAFPAPYRLAGDNRYATAAEIAKKAYPSGAKTVILASGMTYADALVGVPLASKLNAPILLAAKDSLPRETTNALEKLGTKKVIILGGKGAVSEQVETTLKNQGITTERYEGGTRFGTATAIAEKLNENPTDVFFVYYNGFPDALSASTAAALKNAPIIYLTTDGDMNADTAAYLAKLKKAGSVKNAYIIGGTGVITDNMLKKVGTALGVTPKRLDGKDRYETCVAVNNEFKSLLSGKSICVATGADYPDALAGGVFAAIQKAPLFLINGKAQTLILSDKQKAYLKTLTPNMMYVLGGIGVVPDSHVKTVADAWG